MKLYRHSIPFKGDPFDLVLLFKDQPQFFFLDSSLRRSKTACSFMGFAPFKTIRSHHLSDIKKIFNKHRLPTQPGFPAGAVGYLAYDGSMYFGLYDTILSFDHKTHALIVTSFSKAKLKDILERVSTRCEKDHRPQRLVDNLSIEFKSNFTKNAYLNAIRRALAHIRQGDIYQINLAHQIKLKLAWGKYARAETIYGHLRQAFPSEFGAYLDDGQQIILSASPERFLRLQDGTVQVKPMKGTRPRADDPAKDKALKTQLLKSPKEIAELLMVTDLERNDLGRVCKYASIKVKQMRNIETYTSVFQATSTIEGQLRADCDAFDLIAATFPSGSVTGCPKIEAMRIIEKLERVPRGLYTGALGYISFAGDMDFNVMIRSLFLRDQQISFHVGGGIVADSKPEAEWQETWDKAEPMLYALKASFGRNTL